MRPVELTTDPKASPHVCIKCKAHSQVRDWFVDTGTEVEWEGILYICNFCMADIVRVTPDFMSVQAHKEIVSEYTASLDELAALQQSLRMLEDSWMKLTGMNLIPFFEQLEKVNELGRELELSRVISSTVGSEPTVSSDSTESERDNCGTDEPSTIAVPAIEFA